MLAALLGSILLLFLIGVVLDATMEGYGSQPFFVYRLYGLNGLPYWLLSALLLLAANGFLFIRLSRFLALWRWERIGAIEMPVQTGILIGFNLIFITLLAFLFVWIRTMYF